MKLNYEIYVEGKVQQVGYRYFARMKALELGLCGYVRNSPDGKVVVVAEGEEDDLGTLVDYLRIGPPMARVKNVAVTQSPYTGTYNGFSVR